MYKGECGNCHSMPCRASKDFCEATGNTYHPFSDASIEGSNNHFRQEYGLCCGTIDNVKDVVTKEKYIKDGSPGGGCTNGGCCGTGTVWKDGSGCIPTRRGMIDACKEKRGMWGWTCDADNVCDHDHHTHHHTPTSTTASYQGTRR